MTRKLTILVIWRAKVRWRCALAVAFVLPGLAAGPALAQEQGNRVLKAPLSISGPGPVLFLAGEVLDWGRRHADPYSLIVVARLMRKVDFEPLALAKETSGGEASMKTDVPLVSVPSLLEEAVEMARGDNHVVALAEDLLAGKDAGDSAIVGRLTERIEAGATDHFADIAFEAGREAMVFLEGDGDSDLDLQVFDEAGIEICHQKGSGDRELCRWTPRHDGRFTIRIVNHGKVYNRYLLAIR